MLSVAAAPQALYGGGMEQNWTPKPFVTRRKDPLRRWFARLSHDFKTARGGMNTPRQRFFGVLETLFVDHALLHMLHPNRHQVGAGMWRSAQPLPWHMAKLAREGIKSVINLRGSRDCATYYYERAEAQRHGITLVDVAVNSRQPPTKDTLLEIEQLFNTVALPALMHCKAGSDRAGLMSALYLLIHEQRPVEEALKQLSLRYGHVRASKAGVLDDFLEAYRNFNAGSEIATPLPFMEWALTHYDRDAIIAQHQVRPWAEWLYNDVLKRE